jgi:hypothetical protein
MAERITAPQKILAPGQLQNISHLKVSIKFFPSESEWGRGKL